MTKLCCVRATLAVAAFCCLALENRLQIASGCSAAVRSDRNASGGSSGQSGEGCPCTAEPPSRYVNRSDVIKEDILRKLRMLRPPNDTTRLRHLPDIPLLHSIIRQANNENDNRQRSQNENDDDDDDDDHVTAMTILALSHPVPPEERFGLSDIVKFKLNTSGVSGNDVISARLGVYIRPSSTSSSQPRQRWRGSSQRRHRGSSPLSRVQVRDVTRSHAVHPTIRRAVYHVGHQGHWLVFEVKPLVRRWLRRPPVSGRHSTSRDMVSAILQLQATPTAELLLNPRSSADQQLKPYIEIQIRRRPRDGRRRRAASTADLDCDETTSESRCCRYPLTVDFREFGWDWVLAPTRFEAYYCSGLCPFVYYQAHPVSHLTQQMSQLRQGGNTGNTGSPLPPTGTPCCAPTKMAELPLVYLDTGGGIVYGNLPDMITERCGCA